MKAVNLLPEARGSGRRFTASVISNEGITPISTQGNQGNHRKPPIEAARTSLRFSLIGIPSLILCGAIIVAIGVMLFDAPQRIARETAAGLNLGDLVLSHALRAIALDPQPGRALTQLQQELAQLRHITVDFNADEPAGRADHGAINANPVGNWPATEGTLRTGRSDGAPAWFEALFAPPHIIRTYRLETITPEDGIKGTFRMATRPGDEIAEVWRDLVFLTSLLALLSCAIIGLIALSTLRVTRLFRQLGEGLDRLGRGQFEGLAESPVEELARISARFNRLAATLERSEADKHLLIDRLISIQESERKELARELHDEFGAALFGIRAAASCIIEAIQILPPGRDDREKRSIADIIEHASAISGLADAIQRQNRHILERIRPAVLHRMGLPEALRQLVEDWRGRQKQIACTLFIDESLESNAQAFGEDLRLTLYRLVQECLTNIARHSNAHKVSITLTTAEAATATTDASRFLILRIVDDGVGLPSPVRFGYGFLGMTERVRKFGGALVIENSAPRGTAIEARIPLPAACLPLYALDPELGEPPAEI